MILRQRLVFKLQKKRQIALHHQVNLLEEKGITRGKENRSLNVYHLAPLQFLSLERDCLINQNKIIFFNVTGIHLRKKSKFSFFFIFWNCFFLPNQDTRKTKRIITKKNTELFIYWWLMLKNSKGDFLII